MHTCKFIYNAHTLDIQASECSDPEAVCLHFVSELAHEILEHLGYSSPRERFVAVAVVTLYVFDSCQCFCCRISLCTYHPAEFLIRRVS